jgi:peptide methionine sulfoxide reductase MsrA
MSDIAQVVKETVNGHQLVKTYGAQEQEKAALKTIETLDQSARWPQPVVTQVEAAIQFWPAEEYHQRYLEKHGMGFCSI